MMVREMENFDQIRYLVIDVDGTLTDAGIYYDEHGNELKKFCTKDAAGFFAAHQAGSLSGLPCWRVSLTPTEGRDSLEWP